MWCNSDILTRRLYIRGSFKCCNIVLSIPKTSGMEGNWTSFNIFFTLCCHPRRFKKYQPYFNKVRSRKYTMIFFLNWGAKVKRYLKNSQIQIKENILISTVSKYVYSLQSLSMIRSLFLFHETHTSHPCSIPLILFRVTGKRSVSHESMMMIACQSQG